MPRETIPQSPHVGTPAFRGFALPTSNTTYTPNQFFDVCLPYSSRGVVRLVGYLIRQTLGWCDAEGRPQTERHAVSYEDFQRAGISRGMIRSAVDEAIAGHFITCLRKPQSNKSAQPATSGLYELKWDEHTEYVKDPKRFRGFFAGEGNRTYIPNQFFDALLPAESLGVLKVVGSVIRFSIGFQNKWGHRRRNVALSYQHIRNYSHLKDRHALSEAIQHAIESNFIERVEEGYFDPDGGRLSKAAVYAVKWLNLAVESPNGTKSPPAKNEEEKRSEIPTGDGSKTPPERRFKNPTDIEIKQINKTFKQQEGVAAAFSKLRGAGFDTKAAQAIASRYPLEQIERQLRWLESRHVKSNRLGLLRAAIREDWPEPATLARGKVDAQDVKRPRGASFGSAIEDAKRRLLSGSNQSST